MVAVAQFIPQDPKEQESVLAVLREHPELQDFILRASEKAEEIFPKVRIILDTVRYDEWDPPARLMVYAKDHHIAAFMSKYHHYTRWLVYESSYPDVLVQVLPLWDGQIGPDH